MSHGVIHVLSQAGARSIGPFLATLGILILVLTLAGVALVIYRARVLSKGRGQDEMSIMESLREMKQRGEISPEEFEQVKSRTAARLRGEAVPPGLTPAPHAALPGTKGPQAAELRAKPGFDLTGAPLPKSKPERGV